MEQINVTIQTEKGRIDKVLSEHLPNSTMVKRKTRNS